MCAFSFISFMPEIELCIWSAFLFQHLLVWVLSLSRGFLLAHLLTRKPNHSAVFSFNFYSNIRLSRCNNL